MGYLLRMLFDRSWGLNCGFCFSFSRGGVLLPGSGQAGARGQCHGSVRLRIGESREWHKHTTVVGFDGNAKQTFVLVGLHYGTFSTSRFFMLELGIKSRCWEIGDERLHASSWSKRKNNTTYIGGKTSIWLGFYVLLLLGLLGAQTSRVQVIVIVAVRAIERHKN
ncbi:hypothetical protein B0T13DRAFT_85892 [Neurospora crassa]|nr:hypothetical protein B0T13DRAFT_85892 [Neurospora crassa]